MNRKLVLCVLGLFCSLSHANSFSTNDFDILEGYDAVIRSVEALSLKKAYLQKCEKSEPYELLNNELDYLLRRKTSANHAEWIGEIVNIKPESEPKKTLKSLKLGCTEKDFNKVMEVSNHFIQEAVEMLDAIDKDELLFIGKTPRFTMQESSKKLSTQLKKWREVPLEEMKDIAIGLDIGSYFYAEGRSMPVNREVRDIAQATAIFEYIYEQESTPENLYNLAFVKLDKGESPDLMYKVASMGEKRAIYWTRINKFCKEMPDARLSEIVERISEQDSNSKLQRITEIYQIGQAFSRRDKKCSEAPANYLPYINIKRQSID